MRSIVLVLAGLALVACVKDDDRRSTTTLTNATVRPGHPVDNAAPAESPRTAPLPTAIEAPSPRPQLDDRGRRIAHAICDRETFCSRVGEGRTFRSREACTVQFNPKARGFIEAAGCEKGIDDTQLASCLGAVRELRCSGENRPLESLPSCRSICNP